MADFSVVLRLLLFECDTLADFFFVVLFPMSVVITFGYKAQKLPYFASLSDDQVSGLQLNIHFLKL